MSKKRLQLFVIYSLSLCAIISIFSTVIYFSVTVSEEERIKNDLNLEIVTLIKEANSESVDLPSLQQFAADNWIYYVLWDSQTKTPIQKNFAGLSWDPPQSAHHNQLEKLWAQDQNGNSEMIYSVTQPGLLNGKPVELQVIALTRQINTVVSNLTKVLLWGSIILWILGIIFGIMLTYLSMKPVIASWNQQRTFVADASHELRTPLSIITLKSDHLITNPQDLIYDHLEEIAVIQQECRRMYKMVADLLFLAKSDSGVLDVEMTDFSVDQLARELKLLYDEFFEMEEKRFLFDVEYHGIVVGDYEKIKQVCMIIIDNGLRFTKAKDYIKFTARLRGNRVYFDIINDGAPIKNKDLPYIFNRFYKSDTSRNKKNNKEGNGLGLSIAQEIVHAHHSRIRAYVEDEKITGFSFYLNKGKEKN